MPSDPSLGQALSDIEQAMPGFARWLYRSVRRDLGERVLDAGAGIGTYTDLMLRDRKTVTSIEFVPSFVEELHRRFRDDSRVALRQGDLADPTALDGLPPFDSALCLNVFEHIEDDLQAMRNLHDAVRPGGSLVALVPAYHWLFNKMDTAVGHFRRYGRTEYLHRLTEAGWHVERHFRFNAFGVPGWFVAGSLLRRDKPGRDLTRLYDFLIPALGFAERNLIRGAFGLSIVAVCRRPPE